MEASYILFPNYFCINENIITSTSLSAINVNAMKILLVFFFHNLIGMVRVLVALHLFPLNEENLIVLVILIFIRTAAWDGLSP